MPAADAHGLCAGLHPNVHPLLLGASVGEDDVADLEELLVHVAPRVQEAGGHDDAPPRLRLQEVVRGRAEGDDPVGHLGRGAIGLKAGAGHALLVRHSQAGDARPPWDGLGDLAGEEVLEEGLVLLEHHVARACLLLWLTTFLELLWLEGTHDALVDGGLLFCWTCYFNFYVRLNKGQIRLAKELSIFILD